LTFAAGPRVLGNAVLLHCRWRGWFLGREHAGKGEHGPEARRRPAVAWRFTRMARQKPRHGNPIRPIWAWAKRV